MIRFSQHSTAISLKIHAPFRRLNSAHMRPFASLLALIALLLSSISLAPDVHAKGDVSFAHAGDHISAHGVEHFDGSEHNEDGPDQDHSAFHHHNCSFNLSSAAPVSLATIWQPAALKGPLCTSPLVSRVPSVPKQPPKA